MSKPRFDPLGMMAYRSPTESTPRVRMKANEPMYPGAESSVPRGPAIDVGPTCLTCGAAVKPCGGTHWHHVTLPTNPHFPSVREALA